MNNWMIRFLSLFAIVVFIGIYQLTVTVRTKDEEIARIAAELEGEKLKVEAMEEAIAEVEATLSRSSETQADSSRAIYVSGIYEAEARGYGGPVRVRVTVSEQMIEDIEVISFEMEDKAFFSIASETADRILEAQTWDVDVISGATLSSNAIREAARLALEKAAA